MVRSKLSEEQRKANKRISNKKYRDKQKTDKEWNRLMAINPELFPTKPHLDELQKDFIKRLLNMPLDIIPSSNRITRQNDTESKKQIGIAITKIKRKKSPIDFDLTVINDIDYFFERLRDVIKTLLKYIDTDKENWIVYYDYGSGWKQRPIDYITQTYLKEQLDNVANNKVVNVDGTYSSVAGINANNLNDIRFDYILHDHDYDFFPEGIRSLKRLRFVNQTNISKQKHNKKQGKFWKWYLTFNEIDLTKFMIFNKIGKQEASLIDSDNCFIYACRMSGIDNNIIDNLRYCIHKRSLSTSDIVKAAKDCNLRIRIKEIDGRVRYIGTGSINISLILIYEHYMINERVKVSPYYIRNRNAINNDRIARYWSKQDRMLINKKVGAYYKKGDSFSLRKVIIALFEVNAFKPITAGDYMTFSSTICFERINSIQNLEYDPTFCCRLKQSI